MRDLMFNYKNLWEPHGNLSQILKNKSRELPAITKVTSEEPMLFQYTTLHLVNSSYGKPHGNLYATECGSSVGTCGTLDA